MRKQSDATKLRAALRDLKQAKDEGAKWQCSAITFRQRATQAEQEAAAWRKRFDELLSKVTAATVKEVK